MSEISEDQLLSDQDLGEARVVNTNAELTENAIERFERKAHRFVRDRDYFFDTPSGGAYSPTRIYDKTLRLGLGALTIDGNVGAIAPKLEIRHKKNKHEPFILQTQAREFALEAIRLKAIKAFRDNGSLTGDQALKLSGNKDPESALDEHRQRWQAWLAGTRKVQGRTEDFQDKHTQQRITSESGVGLKTSDTRPATSRALKSSRTAASLRRRTILALTGVMVMTGMLLAACGPKEDGTDVPLPTPTGETLPPTATVEPIVGIVNTPPGGVPSPDVPTPTAETGQPAAERPPTLEEAKYGVGGPIPPDIAGEKAKYEEGARGNIPGAATYESFWNQKFLEEYRLTAYGRTAEGDILWATTGIGFRDYPVYWEYVTKDDVRIVSGQTFDTIPDSKDAIVVFAGEYPKAIKDVVTLPDGTQVYSRYWDRYAGEWKLIPGLPEEVLNMPEGATGKNNEGEWIKTVTENEVAYDYVWDKTEKMWLRSLTDGIPLKDTMVYNYIPLKIRISASALGGQNLVLLTHTDEITNSPQPNPLSSTFFPELRKRLNLTDSAEDQIQLQKDMRGEDNRQAMLPIITSTGERVQGKLSLTTGMVTIIVNYTDLEPMIGKGVTKWHDPRGATFLSTVIGVDEAGNIVGKIAYQGDISELTDEQVRWMIFSIVGNVITREDQQIQSFTTLTDIFAQYSARTRADGTRDVGIVRTP